MTTNILAFPEQPTTLPSTVVNDLSSIIYELERKNGLGKNREKFKTCITRSENDYEAFQAWLKNYENKSSLTYSQYKREIERLFIWAITERKKVISDFDVEDFQDYLLFIRNPMPHDKWCMRPSVNTPYGSLDWRPFTGPLNKNARAKATTIIRTMLNFWVNIGYLSLNPLHVIKGDSLDKNNQLFTSQARILEIDEWEALIETLYDLPEETLHQQQEKMRIKLIMMMLFFLGIRIEELTQLTWSALQKQISKRDKRERWWIFVTGKGAKKKKIPVHHLLLETIKSYRALFKLPEEPIAYDPEPFIPSFRKNKGLGKRQIFKLIKDLAQLTIEKYANTRELDIKKLKDFSPHWLRHASASSQNAAGIIDAFIKANMGHSKIETTHIYIHTDDEARHDAIQKLQL